MYNIDGSKFAQRFYKEYDVLQKNIRNFYSDRKEISYIPQTHFVSHCLVSQCTVRAGCEGHS